MAVGIDTSGIIAIATTTDVDKWLVAIKDGLLEVAVVAVAVDPKRCAKTWMAYKTKESLVIGPHDSAVNTDTLVHRPNGLCHSKAMSLTTPLNNEEKQCHNQKPRASTYLTSPPERRRPLLPLNAVLTRLGPNAIHGKLQLGVQTPALLRGRTVPGGPVIRSQRVDIARLSERQAGLRSERAAGGAGRVATPPL